MTKQVAFIVFFLISMGIFSYTCMRLWRFFKVTKGGLPVDRIGKRIGITLAVAFGQTKILRKPVIGLMHALVWWGFIVITIGTAEMAIDGLIGTERILAGFTGGLYDIIVGSGDVFALIIIVMCAAYLIRRNLMHVRRYYGVELNQKNKADANLALVLILLLMVSMIGMNMGYVREGGSYGTFPVSEALQPLIAGLSADSLHVLHQVSWWAHITLVFLFLNILPF